jgi:hypothetical protein
MLQKLSLQLWPSTISFDLPIPVGTFLQVLLIVKTKMEKLGMAAGEMKNLSQVEWCPFPTAERGGNLSKLKIFDKHCVNILTMKARCLGSGMS